MSVHRLYFAVVTLSVMTFPDVSFGQSVDAHAFPSSVARSLSTTNSAGCEGVACPKCNSTCRLVYEKGVQKQTVFDVSCKTICIPKVRLPWQKPCAAAARLKQVKVLEEDTIECPVCEYRWEVVPCGQAEGDLSASAMSSQQLIKGELAVGGVPVVSSRRDPNRLRLAGSELTADDQEVEKPRFALLGFASDAAHAIHSMPMKVGRGIVEHVQRHDGEKRSSLEFDQDRQAAMPEVGRASSTSGSNAVPMKRLSRSDSSRRVQR